MNELHLRLWPIVVSALILWFLGALWYSPVLFAKPWIAIVGRKEGEKPKGVAVGMVSSFIGDMLLALVLMHFVYWSGTTSFAGGAFIGFITWIGFVLAPLFPQHIYEDRPFTYFAINGGYWLLGLLIVGGLIAVWR
ncbi:MAG TPA: DUF1761 domain-containing protein [Terracidiphilus sp.]|nr:DUF1761 domain-containing protein [Terracidiphilus sp.]